MGRGSGGGGRGGGGGSGGEAATGIPEDISRMSEQKIEQTVVPNAELTLKSVLPSDAAADSLAFTISENRDAVMREIQSKGLTDDNIVYSAIDRADWSARYNKPTTGMMTDQAGSGFGVSIRDIPRLDRAANRTDISERSRAIFRQSSELIKYKVNAMWNGASPQQKAAALRALGMRKSELREIGINIQ